MRASKIQQKCFFNVFYYSLYSLLCVLLISSNIALFCCCIKRNCTCRAWCVCDNSLLHIKFLLLYFQFLLLQLEFFFWLFRKVWQIISRENEDRFLFWGVSVSLSLCSFVWQNVSNEVCLNSWAFLNSFSIINFLSLVSLLRFESRSVNLCMRFINTP